MKKSVKRMSTLAIASALLLSMANTAFADMNITMSKNVYKNIGSDMTLFDAKLYKNISGDMTISDSHYYSSANNDNTEHKVIFIVGSDRVNIDGVYLYVDEPPYVSNGRTMLPLRAVAETLKTFENSVAISWNSVDKEAVVVCGDNKIVFKAGSDVYTFNGESRKMSGGMPEIKNGRVFIPVRDIAGAMELDINWNASSKEVTITTA